MLSPDYLKRIAEGSEDIASSLHSYIISRIIEAIMIRLGRGEKYIFTSSDRWRIQILQDAGYLLQDITREISRYTKLQSEEVSAAMEEAGVKAIAYDKAVYEAAGITTEALEQSPVLVRILQRDYEATMGEWSNMTRTTAEAAQSLFISECDNAYHKVISGAVSYTQAVIEAVDTVAQNGVIVRYPTGHRDTIETATARAVRTGISQASGDISMQRMKEQEWDIILVSAHIGARTGDGGQNPGNHLWWQGQFYSRTGKDKRFPPFSVTGYGTGEGLGGWNCRHSFGPGDGVNNPYKDIQTADNERMEKLEQRQRALERRIRKTKQAVMGLQTAVENCKDDALRFELQAELDRKSYLLQKQNAAYKDYCKQNDLRELQDRLMIAKWNRQSAAKARGAAKRYKTAKGID
nr:MAG TPA: minor capsid protein [Caudoviricetes sp.]DAG84419.1 MAG TPA: minor capsid protein [Caudoviricetes sp.]